MRTLSARDWVGSDALAHKRLSPYKPVLADVSFVKDAETWAVNMTKKEFTDALLDRIKDETQEVSEYGALIAQVRWQKPA